MLKPMVRQRETSDDHPKLLKEEWNKFTDFLEDNTDSYEITSIYHQARKRVCTIYSLQVTGVNQRTLTSLAPSSH